MDHSEIQKQQFGFPKEPNKNPVATNGAGIRFIKNEEGTWIAQQLEDSEVEKLKEKKEIGIIVI